MGTKASWLRDLGLASLVVMVLLITIRQTIGLATVQKIREVQADARPDPWTGADSLRWVEEFHRLNPTIKIPDVKHEDSK